MLTASTGTWSNNPTSYTYQWQDCSPSSSCSTISGATSSSYVLQSSDVGNTIDLVVTATNAGGSTSATSAQTVTVGASGLSGGSITPMPLISRSLPAFSSGGGLNGDTTSALNSNDYTETGGTYYGYSCASDYPCYVAYNLSSVPAVQQGQLQQIYTTWYNEADDTRWDYETWDKVAEGVPNDYTIDVACQSLASTTLPTTGWVTQATVTGNTLHTRSHVISMVDTAGNQCNGNYNWIRFNATSGDGVWGTFQMKWDIWNATQTIDDTWMFYGDSIQVNAGLDKDNNFPGDTTLAQMINAWNPSYYPSIENGGMSSFTAQAFAYDGTTVDGLPAGGPPDSSPWFPKNPSHFVVVQLGTNDCNSGYDQSAIYQTALTQVIDGIMADDPSHPTVIVPVSLPASPDLRSGTNTVWMGGSQQQVAGNDGGPLCNAVIPGVIAAEQAKYGTARVLAGPDMWTITNGSGFHWADGLHPNSDAQGFGVYKAAWAQWMETHIY
jgi:hypothetical protein